MPGIGIGISPHFQQKKSLLSYWTTLISATVENTAPTHVVLTFPTAQTSLGASDFTIAGFTISSASWTGAVLTLVVTPAVLFYHGNLTITFVKTGETATVINNVNDSATVGWYVAGDGSATYVTKDGSDFVSVWKDLSGANHHLNQSTGTNQPKYESDGILFDGVGDFMKSGAFTYNQPSFIYIVFKQVTWTSSDAIFDGNNINTLKMRQQTAPPQIAIYAGATYTCNNANLSINEFAIVRALANGASSFIQVNNTTAATGSPGTSSANGFTIGANAGSGEASNIKVKEIILRTSNNDATTQSLIYNYLANKYGFATI